MILYHYCSNATFFEIIQKGELHLTAITLSNDSKEGKLVAEHIGSLIAADPEISFWANQVVELVSIWEKTAEGLAFCLSEEGDLLSQWRAYAANGCGVAIGFDSDYLIEMGGKVVSENASGFALHKVEYDPEAQKAKLEPVVKEMKEEIKKGALNASVASLLLGDQENSDAQAARKEAYRRLVGAQLSLLFDVYTFKGYSFREEREWRLLSYLLRNGRDACDFKVSRDGILPYRPYSFIPSENHAIEEVILGPLNTSPEYAVTKFLEVNGYANAKVTRSNSTYR